MRFSAVLLACSAVILASAAHADEDRYCPRPGVKSCSTDGYQDTCVDYGFSMEWQNRGVTCTPKDVSAQNDAGNADPASEGALCGKAARGKAASCTLAKDTRFTLAPGKSVPEARHARADAGVTCQAGKEAQFYPNGRIKACAVATPGTFMDGKGAPQKIGTSDIAAFDPEGRLAVHQTP